MSNDNEIARGEVDDLLNIDEGLSEWELTFVDRIADRLKDSYGYELTDKQVTKLHQIWDRLCG